MRNPAAPHRPGAEGAAVLPCRRADGEVRLRNCSCRTGRRFRLRRWGRGSSSSRTVCTPTPGGSTSGPSRARRGPARRSPGGGGRRREGVHRRGRNHAPAGRRHDEGRARSSGTRRTQPAPRRAPKAATVRQPAEGESFFRAVNTAALANLNTWVPSLFPRAKKRDNTALGASPRKTSAARHIKRTFSLHPAGIRDFGPRNQPDADYVVMAWGGTATPTGRSVDAVRSPWHSARSPRLEQQPKEAPPAGEGRRQGRG